MNGARILGAENFVGVLMNNIENIDELDVTPESRVGKAIEESKQNNRLVLFQEYEDDDLIEELKKRATTRLEEDETFKESSEFIESEKRKSWRSRSEARLEKSLRKRIIHPLYAFIVFLVPFFLIAFSTNAPQIISYRGTIIILGILVSLSLLCVKFFIWGWHDHGSGEHLSDISSVSEAIKLIDELAANYVEDIRVSLEEEYELGDPDPYWEKVPEYATSKPFQKISERHDGGIEYVETHYLSDLTKYVEEMDKGSIGIAGERGFGKTSLMRALERNLEGKSLNSIVTVWLSAPTAISEEKFLLSVLAKLATRVGGKLTNNKYWPDQHPQEKLRKEERDRTWNALSLMGIVSIVIIFFYFYLLGGSQTTLDDNEFLKIEWNVMLFTFFFILGISFFGRRLMDSRRFSSVQQADRPFVAASADLLEGLWFERTDSLSSEVWLSHLGVSLGGSSGTEKTRQPFTLPHLIQMWDDYIEYITKGDFSRFEKVIVFIDEIDKMKDSSKIGEFMRILKALYNPLSLFFVVSISEDAYDRFQTRMSSAGKRDEFDSSFDHMLQIKRMDYAQTEKLINSRIFGHDLPIPMTLLIWMISKGNPRDALRLTRDIIANYQSSNLFLVAWNLCFEQLQKSCSNRYQSSLENSQLNSEDFVAQLSELDARLRKRPLGNTQIELEQYEMEITKKKIWDAIADFRREILSSDTEAELEYLLTAYELFCCKSTEEFKKLREDEGLLRMISSVQKYLSDGSTIQVLEKLNEFRPCLNLERIEVRVDGVKA